MHPQCGSWGLQLLGRPSFSTLLMQMLDVHKNPLLISILDGVDTLRNMGEKG